MHKKRFGQPMRDAVDALGGVPRVAALLGLTRQAVHYQVEQGRPSRYEHGFTLEEALAAIDCPISALDLFRGSYVPRPFECRADRAPAPAQSTPSSSRRRKPARTPSNERAA